MEQSESPPSPAESDGGGARFTVIRTLGVGGAGRVRLVRDGRQGGVLRALKVAETQQDVASTAAVARELLHEARVLRSLVHPGIPRLYETGTDPQGRPWLLLDYVPAAEPDLSAPDAGRSRLPVGSPVAIARGLLQVLAHLHRHGWLHNDVKPANVLSTPTGRVVLVDFGLASRDHERIGPRGTLPYVAPEVRAGETADRRSDLWSLGAVLLRLVVGRELEPTEELSPEAVPEDVGPLPREWLRRLLHTRPERRFQTADEAQTELAALLGEGVPAEPRVPLPQAPEPVGREVELGSLSRRLRAATVSRSPVSEDAARAESAGLVVVRGEPGVGKSSLLAELRLRAIASGWWPLLGSCSDEPDAVLPGLGRVFQQLIARAPADSRALRRRGRALRGLMTAGSDQDAGETAARFLLERAAEARPLLLLLDDLQFASGLTLRVLASIAREVARVQDEGEPSRVLFVASLTEDGPLPEEVEESLAALEAEGVLASRPIRPLSPRDLVDLSRSVLGDRAPHDRIAEILQANGGSLPLFGQELLGSLVRSGALHHEGGRWLLSTRAAPRLPASLQEAVVVRLRSLERRQLRALQIVATYGRPMELRLSGAYLGPTSAEVLDELQTLGLVAPAGDATALTVVHAVIGRVALSMSKPRMRARLHDHVAAGMARVEPTNTLRRAYHAARGTDAERGLSRATYAARHLRSQGEPGRAAAFVRQALRLLGDKDPRVPLLRRSLAELLVDSGRPEAAANVFRDLLASETALRARAQLLLGLSAALAAAGQDREVIPACREALAALDQARLPEDDPEAVALRMAVLMRLASAERALGDTRAALASVRRALPLSKAAFADQQAALLALLGNVYLELGDLVRARQFHEACLAACRTIGHRRGIATAFHNLGVVDARAGDREAAEASYRTSFRMARRLGDLSGVAQTLGNLANLRAEQGDFRAAERLQRRCLDLLRRVGDLAGIAVTQGNIAGLKRAAGRLGSALELLRIATRTLRALGDARGELQFLLQTAAIHVFANDVEGAQPLLHQATVRAAETGASALEAQAHVLWLRIERRTHPDGDEWRRHLERALDLYRRLSDQAGEAEALLEQALTERDRGRRGSALGAWRAAKSLADAVGRPDLTARADLVRGRLDAHRAPSAEAIEALRRFHAYAREAGRRDYLPTACLSLARALLAAGEEREARQFWSAALEREEELRSSLPPALRRRRESGGAHAVFEAVRAMMPAGDGEEPDFAPEPDPGDDMESDRLLKLLEINKRLNSATEMRELLDAIMDAATSLTGAERGFLILVDDGRISFQTARNFRRESVSKPELKISSSIVKRVMQSGAPVLTDNAREDERFQEYKSVNRLELKSIISLPFRFADQVIGAMYLDNPVRKGAFGSGDVQFLTALADQAALAIRNMRASEAIKAQNQRLEENLVAKSAELEQASRALSTRATKHDYDEIIGRSPRMQQMLLLVDKVVDTQVPVLIQGESGTGKELVARAIHRYGKRSSGPFVPVNCGAIAETLMESELFGHVRGAFTGATADKPGLFQVADGGTIFLDEIGEMDVELQKKLLRVLQEREVRPVGGKTVSRVDVRVIAATNRDLRAMMESGKFRQDLYYRVAVINLDLPPLRERGDDIELLIEHFIDRAAAELGLARKEFTPEAMEALKRYQWPGNVRELDNEVKKALTLSDDRVDVEDLSVHLQGEAAQVEPTLVRAEEGATLKESLEQVERSLIEQALDRTGGNQTQAAKDLGISRVWLRKKMERYGLLQSKK